MREDLDQLKAEFSFGVAIDGSSMALQSLDVVMRLIKERSEGQKPKVEKIHCLHVENPTKQEALSLQSAHFKNSARLRFDKEAMIEMRWHQSKIEKVSAYQPGVFHMLESMARENKVDLLVVGTYGLNGEKKDRIGRMTQFSMANSQTPVFIVKPAFKITEAQRGFLFCVDGLAPSTKAFLFALKYLVRSKDQVYLFYKNTHEEMKGFFDNYIDLLESIGVKYENIFSSDKSKNVAAEIVELAAKLQTEFIVLGKKRTRKVAFLGSISDHVAAKTRSSLILCKDTNF